MVLPSLPTTSSAALAKPCAASAAAPSPAACKNSRRVAWLGGLVLDSIFEVPGFVMSLQFLMSRRLLVKGFVVWPVDGYCEYGLPKPVLPHLGRGEAALRV